MNDLPHVLDRDVLIRADRALVFRYFTDSERWARWWGAGSTIEPRPGGALLIRYPEGTTARGEVVELEAPARIVFTYGFDSGQPIAVGSSLVTITLHEEPRGTVVRLRHAFATAAPRDQHVQGWRYQLAVFARVVADEQHAEAAAVADRWFAAWTEPDAGKRAAAFAACAADAVEFRDQHSCVVGRDEVTAHAGAAQRFMPGIRLQRLGDARQCQGTALVDWQLVDGAGKVLGRGSNVFTLAPDGRIAAAVGLWAKPA